MYINTDPFYIVHIYDINESMYWGLKDDDEIWLLKLLNLTDCTAPFSVGIVTDALTDMAPPDAITANILQSRGRSNLK